MPKAVAPTITFNGGNLGRNIKALPDKVDGQVHAVMVYQSGKALSWMKTTAPWTDRTGNARNGLSSDVGWKPKIEHTMRLFHRVTYGIFLEVRWSGKFAIIGPAIKKFGPDTMRLLEKLFDRLDGGLVP